MTHREYHIAYLFEVDGQAAGKGPYSDTFRTEARSAGASWNTEQKAWMIDLDKSDVMRAALKSAYGSFVDELAGGDDTTPIETKRVLLRVTDTCDKGQRGTLHLTIGFRRIMRIWRKKGRDQNFPDPAKVYFEHGVELVSGDIKMDTWGRMEPTVETILSVELPVGTESTSQFEILGEDTEFEGRTIARRLEAAKLVEEQDQRAYKEAVAIASGKRSACIHLWNLECGRSPRPGRGWVYAYLYRRVAEKHCPVALRAAYEAVGRAATQGKNEPLPEWSHSAHDRLLVRQSVEA